MKLFFNSIIHFFKKYFLKYPLYKRIEEPIIIRYTNESDEEKQGVLFGYNYYNTDNNFGNGDLKLTDLSGKDILYYLSKKPQILIINSIRIFFKEEDRQFYLTQRITKGHTDANGKSYSKSIVPLNYVDSYQSLRDVIDISNFKFNRVDWNTTFDFTVQKKSFIVVSVFLYEEVLFGYFEWKRIQREQDKRHFKNGLIVNQINPKFSLITYFKGLFNIKSYTRL